MNKDAQSHGDHIEVFCNLEEFVDNLGETINKSRLHKGCRAVVSMNEDGKEEETDVVVLRDDHGTFAWQSLLSYDSRESIYNFVTCYPVLSSDRHARAKITAVEPWSNKLEATVFCEVDGQLNVGFFATDYVWNAQRYVVGAELDLCFSALAYNAEESKHEFKFEGQEAIDWLAKSGREPEYDENGNVRPVVFSLTNLVAFLDKGEEYPEIREFQSPIKNVHSFTLDEREFFYADAIFSREPDRQLTLYFAKKDIPHAKNGTPVLGMAWIQGCIYEGKNQ